MKAKEIVDYLLDNDLTKEELLDISVRLLSYVPDGTLMDELRERGYTCKVEFVRVK